MSWTGVDWAEHPGGKRPDDAPPPKAQPTASPKRGRGRPMGIAPKPVGHRAEIRKANNATYYAKRKQAPPPPPNIRLLRALNSPLTSYLAENLDKLQSLPLDTQTSIIQFIEGRCVPTATPPRLA